MTIQEALVFIGLTPTAITGFLIWLLKRYIDKRDAERVEKEQKIEKIMLMIMQDGRATNVLAEATAKAVQRIPDAKCNGDMEAALERARKIQLEEQQFLIDQGIKNIFGN